MPYEIQWTLAVIGGCIGSGALIGIVWAVIREVRRG